MTYKLKAVTFHEDTAVRLMKLGTVTTVFWKESRNCEDSEAEKDKRNGKKCENDWWKETQAS
jgi:hypothetical protein